MAFVRFVLNLLFVYFLYNFVRKVFSRTRPGLGRDGAVRASTAKPTERALMVRCSVCGTALPKSSALRLKAPGGETYACSSACAGREPS